MKTLHTTPFVDISYDEQNKLFKLLWKAETKNMSYDEFKEVMLLYAAEFKRPSRLVLQQMKEMNFSVPLELQTWVDVNVNKAAFDAGVRKGAVVLSPEIFTSVSVEQTLNEENAKDMQVEYFNDENEAMKWLLNK